MRVNYLRIEKRLHWQELIESCLENDPVCRPAFSDVADAIRRLAQEDAAGQLVYALAVQPDRKLSRKDSRKDKEASKVHQQSVLLISTI